MQSLIFNEYIAKVLTGLTWRHFGVGALQAYLYESDTIEQRLHIWHPSLVKPGIQGFGDAHDHRFSFTSQVLCGCIENVILAVTPYCTSESATHDVYEVENARAAHDRTGSHDGVCRVVDKALLLSTVRQFTAAGGVYEFPRGAFHQTRAHDLTVTLVTKFDQLDTRARILCPKGEPLVHAFGGTDPPIAEIVKQAQEALRTR